MNTQDSRCSVAFDDACTQMNPHGSRRSAAFDDACTQMNPQDSRCFCLVVTFGAIQSEFIPVIVV